MEIIKNPHDKFFKETMTDLEVAKDFMNNYLPPEILDLINLDDIELEKDSFIEKELEEVFSDILYKVSLNNKDAYIYLLFEHKSYTYKKISIQLLKYVIKIWELKLKQTEREELPLVIPMVFYHGRQEWNVGLNLSSLLAEIPEELEKYIPNFEYLLYDLSPYSERGD
ncbi:Rpn family recombination-promoting nuclease/putative transposase [Halobacteroides halobius]|uniref:Rpn family recombination-promoting nuclease/putative transposase n=1 Tax=Halobacteroides halobius TaxID=42422 RepID=UPI0002FD4169|nr:Rpn family recombination-promoting nuclease/putative transposase [Halobacteroides halobius]